MTPTNRLDQHHTPAGQSHGRNRLSPVRQIAHTTGAGETFAFRFTAETMLETLRAINRLAYTSPAFGWRDAAACSRLLRETA